MSYAWTKEKDREPIAARIPKGEHHVRILRIMFGSRDGAFQSRDGDPQIMIIFQDREAREAGQMVTLNEKAAWALAKILDACDPSVNLARMEADGVEPAHFADREFAESVLLNRELVAHVDWEPGEGNKQYARVTPIKRTPSSASPPAAEAPPTGSSSADAPPADDAPPSEAPPSLAFATKDEAWTAFLQRWGSAETQEAKTKRNMAWLAAIRAAGKPEQQFTPEDWGEVVARAEVPF
jgi:hypothetical protein